MFEYFPFDKFSFNAPDLLFIFIYFFISFILLNSLKKADKKIIPVFTCIIFLHSAITIGYWYYTTINPADSIGYYSEASKLGSEGGIFRQIGQGADFILFILAPFVAIFNLSYFGSFFVFSTFGLGGYYYLIKTIIELAARQQASYKTNQFYFLLLPGIHFWSCSVGKEPVIFLGITMLLFGFLSKRAFHLIVGVILVGFVRSHVLLIISTGVVLGYVFLAKGISKAYKVMVLLASSMILYLLLPFVMQRLGLDELNTTNVESYVSQHEGYNQRGGGAVDLSNSNIAFKMISYLYRPFFIDARSVFGIITSFENIAWVVLTWQVFKQLRMKILDNNLSESYAPLFFSFLLLLIGSSSILNNLGIAARQKTMLFPMVFLMYFLSLWWGKTIKAQTPAKVRLAKYKHYEFNSRKNI
ncbi:hypothetical protein [Pontibacter flavimaris]|uniref:EpsG family protein n=1 Tax=Pontibacter flavimaris TaxID=1797110 RepID=A0A1Q5PCC3_9BACT|nr:hypothetical protein [Pontibacter flavimaris]OKL39886.1 hypothetical protein A3841_16040 [Pontibacter flavimaris]